MANNLIFGSMLKYENCFQIQYILDVLFFRRGGGSSVEQWEQASVR